MASFSSVIQVFIDTVVVPCSCFIFWGWVKLGLIGYRRPLLLFSRVYELGKTLTLLGYFLS